MPDQTWNKATFDGGWDWEAGGEEWSSAWGSSEAQWFGSIYPRVHRFLPADWILEIAPGAGRWTRFLLPATGAGYLGIDLSVECIERCRTRFGDVPRARFESNNGLSLAMAPDDTFDFVFSFDSLVHVEIDVLESYIPQILRKLRGGGAAFLHHSNWLESGERGSNRHCRAESVGVSGVARIVEQNGGRVLIQEAVNWESETCVDCFTTFARADGEFEATGRIIHNLAFVTEAAAIRDAQSAYATLVRAPRRRS